MSPPRLLRMLLHFVRKPFVALLIALADSANASLTLAIYNNTVFGGTPVIERLDTVALTLPGSAPFSAEVIGTLSPRFVSNATAWGFQCRFENVAFAFVRIDGHMVCQLNAYNGSGVALMDGVNYSLGARRKDLTMSVQLYHLIQSSSRVVAELRWCENGDKARCTLLPTSTLFPEVPDSEQARRKLQRGMLAGWGSWLHRDALSVVLLPDSAILTVMICQISSGECLRGLNIDGNGGAELVNRQWDQTHPVRVGAHAINHSYSQIWVWGPPSALRKVNVSIEYSVGPADGLGGERQLNLLVTPSPQHTMEALTDFAVAFVGSFGWGRLGEVIPLPGQRILEVQGYGLDRFQLFASAEVLLDPIREPGVVAPGLLEGMPCKFEHNSAGDKDCASGRCVTPVGEPWAEGKCSKPQSLPHLAFSLGRGAVGISTRPDATLLSIQQSVSLRALAEKQHQARFGVDYSDIVEAIGAAVSWRNIFVPVEEGPVMPVTYGFSWLTPGPLTNDWRYVLFCWDNIFASYIAGVLGYREAAYSNLIQIMKSKAADGYVPNWYSGGYKNQVSEPAVGSRVLLDLYERFGDVWIVELLFDDLLDWNNWQWTKRRVVGVPGSLCEEPGFITIGNDYADCTTNASQATNCPGGLESGLDQSPLWDCPDAAPDGSGGNCSVLFAPSTHVMQLADMGCTSVFVMDAESLARLADILNRVDVADELRQRANIMKAQLAKGWNSDALIFADIYVKTGRFSDKLTPTAFYPLFANAASDEQAALIVERHLLNTSEFCISATYAVDNPETCYWGLPSVAANSRQFMQPPGYIYWRGLSWGPMTLMTYWGLDAYKHIPRVKDARAMLVKQKTDMMMSMWRRHRHICENYSPYSPDSKLSPGTGQRNTECTGWQFYHWGALHGLTTLLELLDNKVPAETSVYI